ncbi:MAG: hypothetical protein JNJ98_06800, partial [Gemmatimonadetes bacterium]|nr:hypothetical protein [Gemmatimonadota bacterium]
THVATVEQAYTPATRAAALAQVDQLAGAADTISPIAFDLAVARILARADNGHTNVGAFQRGMRYPKVGLRFVPLENSVYVFRARPEHRDLLGARLVSVDGTPFDQLRSAAHALTGGTPAFRDRFVPILVESPPQLNAVGAARAATHATYRFALVDGSTVERRLEVEPVERNLRIPVTRWLYPEPVAGDSSTWAALQPAQVPWALQDPVARFRLTHNPAARLAIVELRQNMTTGAANISDFLRGATDSLQKWTPDWIVLDLRMNGGGDLNTTRTFARALPVLARQRVFVLTSPWTFSAAISTVGYLKQAAPDRVTIVGEEIGDRLEFWAEGRPVTLVNTGIVLSVSRERHDYANGCRAYRDCHGSVVRQPIAVPSLLPDVVAPWTLGAYRSGVDPGMAAVERRIRATGASGR